MRIRSTLVAAIVALASAMAIELLVFNANALASRSFDHIEAQAESLSTLAGAQLGGAALVAVDLGDGQDLQSVSVSYPADEGQDFGIYTRSAGDGQLHRIASASADDGPVRIHEAGLTKEVVVVGDASCQGVSVQLNPVIPLAFGKRRMATIALIIFMAWSAWECQGAHGGARRPQVIVAAACVAVALVALVLYAHAGNPMVPEQHRQYQKLAVSLSEGHLYLDDDPPSALAALENPYDTNARGAAVGTGYAWDTAYFKGRYYVYFGVLPAVVFYLPFHLLTGGDLPNHLVVAACLVMFAFGAAFALWQLARTFAPLRRRGAFALAYGCVILLSWAVYAAKYPDLYAVPISMGLALGAWGLGLWLRGTATRRLSMPAVVAGSACVGTIVLCRPQLLVLAPLGIGFAHGWRRRFESRIGWRRTCVAALPFIAAFVVAGAYNQARFGSPLDFGASYNLTYNDMTHRGVNLDRTYQSLFCYLFQPPAIGQEFPFLQAVDTQAPYRGVVISETMYGGFLTLSPLALVAVCLLAPSLRRSLARRGALLPALISVAAVPIVVVFDANAAGLLMRYFMDFGLAGSIACVYAIGTLAGTGPDGGDVSPAEGVAARADACRIALAALAASTLALSLLWLQIPPVTG